MISREHRFASYPDMSVSWPVSPQEALTVNQVTVKEAYSNPNIYFIVHPNK